MTSCQYLVNQLPKLQPELTQQGRDEVEAATATTSARGGCVGGTAGESSRARRKLRAALGGIVAWVNSGDEEERKKE